jgi:membrane protease subunit HflC
MDRRWALPLGLVLAALVVWNLCFFTVPQWMQALVVQLGNPVRTVSEPGLYAKIPLIQEVLYFDRRLLLYDAAPKEILTRDKQQLVVDNYARWRIADPLQFYRTVRNEAGAQSRLDDIIYSNLRETLGRHTLDDIVSTQRSDLMAEITQSSGERTREYGIELADVRIKRADLPEKNEQNVFSRMRAERERLAKKFRAEGEEESRKIRSEAEKEVRILLAEAGKKAEILRGEGDAEAVKIFADAYGRDPEFFDFQRSLEVYRNGFPEGTRLVVSPHADFFGHLWRGGPAAPGEPPAD